MNVSQVIQPSARMQRKMRNPQHRYQTQAVPFQIVPFTFAQVFPGETLKKAMVQSKIVSDPILNDLVGWHAEHYFFFVKLTDLDDAEKFKEMVVDPDYDAVANGLTSTTADPFTFFNGAVGNPSINYVQKCLDVVVREFFRDRDQGELETVATIDGKYAAKITIDDFTQSIGSAAEYSTPDVNVDLDGNATITASEVTKAQQTWMTLVSQGLIEKTFEDFCRSYGIKLSQEVQHRPELIRYMRDWTYPTRLVDPATGAPTSAVQWSVQDSIDKDRFFKEPGFLLGVQCFRPKIYISGQTGTMTSQLTSGLDWLPAETLNSLHVGLKEFAAGDGPIPSATGSYVVDIRDLLRYGEQFVNFSLATAGKNIMAVPTADLTRTRYVSDADVQSLFSLAANRYIRSDGVVRYMISSQLGNDLTGATV